MRYTPFGSTGSPVPVIGQGTWYIEAAQRATAVKALREGLDLGATHIDTAEMYGDGKAEEVVGEAIHGRRSDVFLVSKVLPHNASRSGVRKACEQSLKRLGTDMLDCYLLHWRGGVPLAETFAGMEDLLRDGKIRSYGVSNFDVPDLEEALAILGPGKLACNQVLYHLNERAIEHRIVPWCASREMAVVAYSPFGHEDFPEPGTSQWAILDEIAQRYGATPRQVSLAYLVRQPLLFAIPKASSQVHAAENAGAGSIALSDEDAAHIDAAFPRGQWPGYLPMI